MNKLNNVVVSTSFDAKVYSLEAIKNASYDFTEKATIVIEAASAGRIQVNFKVPVSISEATPDSLISEFIRLVTDHQIRVDVGRDYKLVREMIIAQAFEPVDNLDIIVSKIQP